ncbi:MAG: carboxypeptidase-like regulatory domain-containing protein, partial [Bryobacteraceae bacterium]
MKSKLPIAVAAIALIASAPTALRAQANGTIHGTAFDSSGAVVPDASITATNVNTNLIRRVVADSVGQYVIPLLPVGEYSVRVESQGFAPFLQTGIRLQVSTDMEVNARLELKAATEQVTVRENTTLVQTTTSALVQVVDERRISDLPLNGRNVLQLMALNSGISDRGAAGGTIQTNTFGNGQFQVAASINGSRGNGTNYLLDNADNNDGFTNVAEAYPNPDAIQEFSIQSSSFDAQYGRGVGGVVNVVTRSGTNQFHGTAFEFLRNNKLNAGNFFTGKDALKRNQFGVTAGGPVLIPKLYNGKDRTFIFGSYQGTRSRIATPGVLRTAPSEAMKQGDLSSFLRPDGTGAIHDPNAPAQYFPGNRIPVSRFDPVSAKLLSYIPSSADPNYQLRFGTPTQIIDDDQMTLRFDHSFSDRQRLSTRYFLTTYNRPWSFIPSNLLLVNAGQYGHAQNLTVSHNYARSRFLNDFSFTFHGSTPTAAPPADLNISFETLGARVKTVPGFPTMDVGISNWSGIGLGLGYYNGQRTYQFAENIAYVTGRQNLRFGVDYRN